MIVQNDTRRPQSNIEDTVKIYLASVGTGGGDGSGIVLDEWASLRVRIFAGVTEQVVQEEQCSEQATNNHHNMVSSAYREMSYCMAPNWRLCLHESCELITELHLCLGMYSLNNSDRFTPEKCFFVLCPTYLQHAGLESPECERPSHRPVHNGTAQGFVVCWHCLGTLSTLCIEICVSRKCFGESKKYSSIFHCVSSNHLILTPMLAELREQPCACRTEAR